MSARTERAHRGVERVTHARWVGRYAYINGMPDGRRRLREDDAVNDKIVSYLRGGFGMNMSQLGGGDVAGSAPSPHLPAHTATERLLGRRDSGCGACGGGTA